METKAEEGTTPPSHSTGPSDEGGEEVKEKRTNSKRIHRRTKSSGALVSAKLSKDGNEGGDAAATAGGGGGGAPSSASSETVATDIKKEKKREKVKKLLSGATRSLDKDSGSSSSSSGGEAKKKKKSGSVRVARVTPSTTKDKLKEAAERRKSHIPFAAADPKSPRGGGGGEEVRFDGNASVVSLTQELEEEWEGARYSGREAATRAAAASGGESEADSDDLAGGEAAATPEVTTEYDYTPVMSPRVRQTSLEDVGESKVLGKWDDFEMQHLEYVEASASLDPAVREALLSPDQPIRVKKKRRQERTLAPSVPEDLLKSQTENAPWLNACLSTFTKDWMVIKQDTTSDTETNITTACGMWHIRWDALKQRSRRGALLTNASSTSSPNLKKAAKAKVRRTDQPAPNMNVRLNPLLRAAADSAPSTPKGNIIPSPPPPPISATDGGASASAPNSARETGSNQGSGAFPVSAETAGAQSPLSGSGPTALSPKERRATRSFERAATSSGEVPLLREEYKFHIEEDICNKPFDKAVLQQNKDTLYNSNSDLFSSNDQQQGPSKAAVVSRPFPPTISTRLLIHFKELKFQLFELQEPLFCTAALYDTATRTRISESFHFDYNGQLELGVPLSAQNDIETQARKAVFKIYHPTPAIYLVIRIEKMFCGNDLDKEIGYYLKAKYAKAKDAGKLKEEIEQFVKHNKSAFKHKPYPVQPFAWAAAPVFTESYTLRTDAYNTMKIDYIVPIAKHGPFDDQSLLDVVLGGGNDKKESVPVKGSHLITRTVKSPEAKTIGAQFELEVLPLGLEETVTNTYDPSFLPVGTTDEFLSKNPCSLDIVREVESLEMRKEPFVTYVNNLYVYPETLSLKGGPASANFQIEVRLKDTDTDVNSKGLPVVYGKSSMAKFNEVGCTNVLYHEKKPHFYDELKFKVPGVLTPKHHLLLTIYHINVSGNKAGHVPLGYAVLPLATASKSRKGEDLSFIKHVRDGRYTLAVVKELPAGYLTAPPSLANKDVAKSFVVVSTRMWSSIYTQDKQLRSFFRMIRPTGELTTTDKRLKRPSLKKETTSPSLRALMAAYPSDAHEIEILNGMDRASGEACVLFMPLLLNELFRVLCTREKSAQRKLAFLGIVHVVQRAAEATGEKVGSTKSELAMSLASYVRFMFDNVEGGMLYPYEQIAKYWMELLQEKHPAIMSFKGVAFLLEVMTKSMILKIHSTGEISARPFLEAMSQLTNMLFVEGRGDGGLPSLTGISIFPAFLREMLKIMDRGIVLNMVWNYISGVRDAHARLGKFKFLRTLFEYDNFVPLSLPLLPQSIPTLDPDLLLEQHMKQHFFVGLLIREIASTVDEPKSLRAQGINTLRNLLKKHGDEPRYQSRTVREHIANLYFPYVLLMVERADSLVPYGDEREWFACLMWIFRHASRNLIRTWWKKDAQKRHAALLRLLTSCLGVFDHDDGGEEVGLIIADLLVDFMGDFEDELNSVSSVSIGGVLTTLHRLLHNHASGHNPKLLDIIYTTLQFVVHVFKQALFEYGSNSKFCELLSFEILAHCNSTDALIRSKAASMFYLFLRKNWETSSNLSRMQVQSTVAVSRLVGGMKDNENLNFLKDSLKAIKEFSNASAKKGKQADLQKFDASVAELIARMFRLIDYSAKIYGSNVRNDPETIAEVYLRISNDYFDSPDLRVQWLRNLAEFQVNQGNPEEAAQCKLHIAALVVEYLVAKGQLQVRHLSKAESFLDIAPNVMKDMSLPQIQDDSTFQNVEIWSPKGLTKLLKSAVKLLEQAKAYEVCLEVLMMLTTIFSSEKQYPYLSQTLERFRALTDTLITANKEVRVFPVYYRVGYYGSKFEELDGKEFVYRLPGHTKLGHMQTQLKARRSTRAYSEN
ncbi:uncharacterized protein ACA1_067810 [Acanthamoeba castellanii str. Neff]|uniref:C2 DOCK-type domain-containing protein n=1 Tax=Acanthamoeba castellanii (strain ATCC 30010 / Neff) TaxID=1257118 RepID=L8HD90_ACACF|nr:uncharacterized protein ACA1_067810 [Acanthamoeba castellanii str. Neff]ELR23197.1 hypothetical protein ACA1_067810 [Acanthamoeba castellanii str. Neff]